MGNMLFTIMAPVAQVERDLRLERVNDSIAKRRADGRDLGGRPEKFTMSQISNARRLIDSGQSAAQVARDLGMSRATLYRRLSEPAMD